MRKIILHKSEPVDDKRISLLPKIARNLIEASFNCRLSVQVETIVQLLNESKHMKRLYLHELGREYVNDLKVQVEDKWNLRKIEEFPLTILIERK